MFDPVWQEAATRNASNGYPWAVWGGRPGSPFGLLDSKATEAEARRYADSSRASPSLRKQKYVFLVANESPNRMEGDPS